MYKFLQDLNNMLNGQQLNPFQPQAYLYQPSPLPQPQEQQFQKWFSNQQFTGGINTFDSGQDYDFRQAYLNNLKSSPNNSDSNKMHWSDTYKLPNERGFSDESQYAPFFPERAGTWLGETYIPPNYYNYNGK